MLDELEGLRVADGKDNRLERLLLSHPSAAEPKGDVREDGKWEGCIELLKGKELFIDGAWKGLILSNGEKLPDRHVCKCFNAIVAAVVGAKKNRYRFSAKFSTHDKNSEQPILDERPWKPDCVSYSTDLDENDASYVNIG